MTRLFIKKMPKQIIILPGIGLTLLINLNLSMIGKLKKKLKTYLPPPFLLLRQKTIIQM